MEKSSYGIIVIFPKETEGKTVNSPQKRETVILATTLAVSFLVRLILFPLHGYTIDTNDFLAWFNTAATHGIRPFYNSTVWTDYPPLNVYFFWFFGSIANAAAKAGINAVNIVKLAPNIFDLGTAALIYIFVRRQASFKLAIAATALYAFNPAVIYDTAVWGQYDAIYTFFLVLSLMLALRSKPLFSAASFALGILTKPQGIALAPLIAFLIYKKNGLKQTLFSLLAFAATVFVVILPFNWGGSPVSFLTNIYFGAYKGYAYTSVNAFNLWGLISGMWVPDGNLYIVGWVLFGAFVVFTLYYLNKHFNVSDEFIAVFAAFMLLFAFFMLPTRIHERYLFPAISVLALMFPFVKRARPLYAVLTATLFVNEAYVLYWLNKAYPYAPNLTGDPVVLVVSAINLLMLGYASFVMWDKRTWLKTPPAAPTVETPSLIEAPTPPSPAPPPPPSEPLKKGNHALNVDLGLKLDRKDVITIFLLCIVFFSIAVVDLGYTTYPTTNTQVTPGQGFYLNLGTLTNVKSVLILMQLGVLNVTVYSGSPGNWTLAANSTPNYSSSGWSEDYCKWYEINVGQTTQYLDVEIGYVPSYLGTTLSQVAVVNDANQIVPINSGSITNDGAPSLPVENLVNAQSSVHYPIDYMENTYFDEIYFVRTAQEYLHLQPAYEWTHPPLGKIVQAAGILAFGFNPFGWRIMGVIFATLMIALIYLVGKRLLGTWIGGFTAAFMLTFDFMHFTMARMGTADTYLVFFSLASQLFFLIYLKNVLDHGWKTSVIPLFLCVMFAALGISTKWLVLFGFVGALCILLVMRLGEVKKLKAKLSDKIFALLDHPYSVLVGFLLLAIGVYFISYIPEMLAGRSFMGILNLQEQMYIYQSTLKATHPFQSPFYSWPLMFNPFNSGSYGGHVPLWLQEATLLNGKVSTITLLGNPALWWVGFAIIVGLTISYVPRFFTKGFDFKANVAVIFIIVYFFFQWLPYIFITRIVFIYHFYSNVPFLCLAVAYMVNRFWSNKYMKILTVAYFALTIGLFVLFYPVISGVPTTTTFIHSLTWFKGWILGP